MSPLARRLVTCASLVAVCSAVPVTARGAVPPPEPAAAAGASWFADPPTARRDTLLPVPRRPARYDDAPRRWTRALHRTFHGALALPVGRIGGRRLVTGQAVVLRVPVGYPLVPPGAPVRGRLARLADATAQSSSLTCEGYVGYGRAATRPTSPVSRQRAAAVCQALRSRTTARTRSVGYGDARPVVVGGPSADRRTQRAANRRVVVVVTGGLAEAGAPARPVLRGASYFDGDRAYLYWIAPAGAAGAPVTGYQVSVDRGRWTRAGADLQQRVAVPRRGCADPVPHTFRVRALNARGRGSVSRPLTLEVPGPGSPTINAHVRCR